MPPFSPMCGNKWSEHGIAKERCFLFAFPKNAESAFCGVFLPDRGILRLSCCGRLTGKRLIGRRQLVFHGVSHRFRCGSRRTSCCVRFAGASCVRLAGFFQAGRAHPCNSGSAKAVNHCFAARSIRGFSATLLSCRHINIMTGQTINRRLIP